MSVLESYKPTKNNLGIVVCQPSGPRTTALGNGSSTSVNPRGKAILRRNGSVVLRRSALSGTRSMPFGKNDLQSWSDSSRKPGTVTFLIVILTFLSLAFGSGHNVSIGGEVIFPRDDYEG